MYDLHKGYLRCENCIDGYYDHSLAGTRYMCITHITSSSLFEVKHATHVGLPVVAIVQLDNDHHKQEHQVWKLAHSGCTRRHNSVQEGRYCITSVVKILS